MGRRGHIRAKAAAFADAIMAGGGVAEEESMRRLMAAG